MKRLSLLMLYLFAAMLVACAQFETPTDVPSASLANYQVVDQEGNVIARLEDVLIAADRGQISYALLVLQRDSFYYGKAAFAETIDSYTAVPWDYFSLDSASKQLQLEVDGSVLFAAPLLREKSNHLAPDWDTDIRAYWQAYAISKKQE